MVTPLLALLAALVAGAAMLRRRHARLPRPAQAAILREHDGGTTIGPDGTVRSIQAADLTLPREALEELWSPAQLERLARTYWRFLSRVTLGLVRVDYGETQRTVVLLRRPLRLLRFKVPEYAMDDERGSVRWRIEDGLLVERRGHHSDGYLQIDVRRLPAPDDLPSGMAVLRVEVEVANFYPSIARRLSTPVYRATQSRIHVLVTHGFLRSLERLDLAESRVGKLARLQPADGPDPPAMD